MTKANSSESKWAGQYKHPMWQKKRLEMLEHAGYTCQVCGATDKQLHVHHVRYSSGRKVWEYSRLELVVLCERCHRVIHDQTDDVNIQLTYIMHALILKYRIAGLDNLSSIFSALFSSLTGTNCIDYFTKIVDLASISDRLEEAETDVLMYKDACENE